MITTVNTNVVLYCLLAFVSSFLGQKVFIKIALSKKLMDVPNERSSHAVAKPRGGGLVVYLLSLIALGLIYFAEQPSYFYVLSVAATLVALIGFKDDVSGASIRIRLILHILAAGIVGYFYSALLFLEFNSVAVVTALVCIGLIIFCINIYNFMDGIDGICAGFALSVLLWMAVLLQSKNDSSGMTFCLMLVFLLLGFLLLNWQPSNVFMGDVGSGFLGVLIPTVFIYSFGISLFMIFVFCILNAAFFADSIWTLGTRILRKEMFYMSHRQHAYQHASLRLKSHAKVSLYYILYTLLYAGPLAFASTLWAQYLPLFFVLAYLPTIPWLIKNRAGLPS